MKRIIHWVVATALATSWVLVGGCSKEEEPPPAPTTGTPSPTSAESNAATTAKPETNP